MFWINSFQDIFLSIDVHANHVECHKTELPEKKDRIAIYNFLTNDTYGALHNSVNKNNHPCTCMFIGCDWFRWGAAVFHFIIWILELPLWKSEIN